MSPQLLQGDPAWRKLMAERRFDAALPERCAEAQPRREVEHDLQVRAGLAARRAQRLSEPDERLRLLADFEADL